MHLHPLSSGQDIMIRTAPADMGYGHRILFIILPMYGMMEVKVHT